MQWTEHDTTQVANDFHKDSIRNNRKDHIIQDMRIISDHLTFVFVESFPFCLQAAIWYDYLVEYEQNKH